MLRSISEKHSAAAISLNLSFKSKTLTARRPDWSKSSQEPRSEGKPLIGLADDDVIRFSSAIGRWIDDVQFKSLWMAIEVLTSEVAEVKRCIDRRSARQAGGHPEVMFPS